MSLPLLILVVFFSACQDGQTPPTNTPTAMPTQLVAVPETIINGEELTIFVEPVINHQTIKDVTGGNFINVFSGTTDPLEPVSSYNLEHLDVRVARVRMTLETWEPVNDDDDPNHINWDAFQDTEYNQATFRLMQDAFPISLRGRLY